MYTDKKGEHRARFLGRNGKNFEDGYRKPSGCQKKVLTLVEAIKNGDFEIVDNMKRRK